MDSGNSGSLQSSSGDEEFDSRADAISAFMTNNPPPPPPPPAHVGPIFNPPPPPQTTTNSSSIFDHHHHRQPLSNYFDSISRPPPSAALLNLDTPWSKTLRSDPNSTEIMSPLHSLFAASQPQLQTHHGGGIVSSSSAYAAATQAVSIPPVVPETTSDTNTPRSAPSDHHQLQTHAGRNPKKRSRASRRAPTTVLTTDTTNFRAMVQEFTGIPAPPFTSSPFSRNRGLDLYAPPPSAAAAMRSNNPLDASQQPPYLRRPFPQKVQLPPPPSFLAASSVIDHALASSNSTNNINTNISAGLNINVSPNGTSSDHHINYQMPSELGLLKQPLINPVLTSLLQSNSAKFPPPSYSSILGSKASSLENIPSNDSHLKMGSVLDEFNLSHGQVNTAATTLNGLPDLISSDHHHHQTGLISSNDHSNDQNQTQSQVRSAAGIKRNFNFSRNINDAIGGHGKLNYSASSSSFHGDKGSDNVNAASRGDQGMTESWICSSE